MCPGAHQRESLLITVNLVKQQPVRLDVAVTITRPVSHKRMIVVALGKRYSDRLYFSFEQAIGATTEYLVKLDYALTRRVSLRGQTGTTSGAGIFYRYSWD